jgi:hypothetical protein
VIVEGIARQIGANVAGLSYSLTNGGNVFEEDMPQEPDLAVAVYSAGGPAPSARRGEDEQDVQLIFRSDPESAVAASNLWYAVFDHLHALRNATLPDGTLIAWALVQQSAPIRLGNDENGRMRYSMNVRCDVRRPSGQRE